MRFTRNALPGIIMSLTTRWHNYEQPSKSEYGSRAADGIFFLSPHYIAHFAGSNNGVIRTRWNPQQFTAVTLGCVSDLLGYLQNYACICTRCPGERSERNWAPTEWGLRCQAGGSNRVPGGRKPTSDCAPPQLVKGGNIRGRGDILHLTGAGA